MTVGVMLKNDGNDTYFPIVHLLRLRLRVRVCIYVYLLTSYCGILYGETLYMCHLSFIDLSLFMAYA